MSEKGQNWRRINRLPAPRGGMGSSVISRKLLGGNQVACVQISFPVSRHVQPCSSSVIHTAAQHGQRPVLCCLPTSTVVPGCSRSVPGQAGQWPSASRLSRVLSHDVAAASQPRRSPNSAHRKVCVPVARTATSRAVTSTSDRLCAPCRANDELVLTVNTPLEAFLADRFPPRDAEDDSPLFDSDSPVRTEIFEASGRLTQGLIRLVELAVGRRVCTPERSSTRRFTAGTAAWRGISPRTRTTSRRSPSPTETNQP